MRTTQRPESLNGGGKVSERIRGNRRGRFAFDHGASSTTDVACATRESNPLRKIGVIDRLLVFCDVPTMTNIERFIDRRRP